MSNSSYYKNAEFLNEKKKSLGFDINSHEYKMMKINTFMRLSSGFIKESINEEKKMSGICAIFYVPNNQKNIQINYKNYFLIIIISLINIKR